MNDQLNEKSVALYIKAGKLTGRVLAQAMRAFLKKAREPTPPKHGKQSVKSLTKQGSSLTNIEITGENIGDFKKTARKFNVDFALKRDDAETPPKWLVFFKAKDTDALTAAFKEFSAKMLTKTKEKPSVRDTMQKFRDIIKNAVREKVKNKHREGPEL